MLIKSLSKNRNGMGIAFIVVMVVLVFLAIAGLGIKYFTRGATRVSESILAGQQAVVAAEGAIEETWATLEATVNDSDSATFTIFTEALADGKEGSFSMIHSPVATKRLYSDNGSVSVGDVNVWIPRQFRIWGPFSHEKWGVLCAQVKVEVSIPGIFHSVTRTVTQWREFKVVYPSPPTPFDGMSFFCLIPGYLKAYEAQYRQIQADVDSKIKEEEDRLSDKKPFGDVDLPRPFENNADVYKYFPNFKYPPFPYNVRAGLPSAYGPTVPIPLEETDMDNCLFSHKRLLTGEDFKLRWPENLENITQDPLFVQLQADAGSATLAAGDEDLDAAAIADLELTLANLKSTDPLKPYETYIKATLKKYSDTFAFLAEDELPAFGEGVLVPFLKLVPDGTITVDNAIAFYKKNRCTHVFPDQAALYAEIGQGSEVFLDGIYYVDGPIDINFRYRGKGTIVGKNYINVTQCDKADGENDTFSICTLMSFCQRDASSTGWCSIDLNCDPHASLVALTGRIKNLYLHKVKGSVVVGIMGAEEIDGINGVPGSWQIQYDPSNCVINPFTFELKTHRCRVVIGQNDIGTRVSRR
jgi:hypothetical protein